MHDLSAAVIDVRGPATVSREGFALVSGSSSQAFLKLYRWWRHSAAQCYLHLVMQPQRPGDAISVGSGEGKSSMYV